MAPILALFRQDSNRLIRHLCNHSRHNRLLSIHRLNRDGGFLHRSHHRFLVSTTADSSGIGSVGTHTRCGNSARDSFVGASPTRSSLDSRSVPAQEPKRLPLPPECPARQKPPRAPPALLPGEPPARPRTQAKRAQQQPLEWPRAGPARRPPAQPLLPPVVPPAEQLLATGLPRNRLTLCKCEFRHRLGALRMRHCGHRRNRHAQPDGRLALQAAPPWM